MVTVLSASICTHTLGANELIGATAVDDLFPAFCLPMMLNPMSRPVPARPPVIARTYHGSLFERLSREGDSQLALHRQKDDHASRMQQKVPPLRKGRRQEQQGLGGRQEPQYRMTVVGVVPVPGKKPAAIIAGRYKQQNTGEIEVVAVRVNAPTLMFNGAGERISPTAALELQEGVEIVVNGEKTKRNVIRASCVRFSG